MDKEKVCYLAGLIDGEGSLYIQKINRKNGSTHYEIRFHITNTNPLLSSWLKSHFGGLVYERKGCNERCKNRFEWVATRKLFDIIAPKVLPYLVIKHQQVKLGIEFRQTFTKTSRKPTEAVSNFRNECYHKLKLLNKKGV